MELQKAMLLTGVVSIYNQNQVYKCKGDLHLHICCAIMMIPLAGVALRILGMENSSTALVARSLFWKPISTSESSSVCNCALV